LSFGDNESEDEQMNDPLNLAVRRKTEGFGSNSNSTLEGETKLEKNYGSATMSEVPINLEKLLEHFPGVSERGLKKIIRQHGIGSRIGNKLFFFQSDVQKLMKATQCSQPIDEAASGTVAALSPESESAEVLKQAIERSRSNTPTKSKRASSRKACSVKKQRPPSPRPAEDTSTIVRFPAAATK
jgi:hypothetical protein